MNRNQAKERLRPRADGRRKIVIGALDAQTETSAKAAAILILLKLCSREVLPSDSLTQAKLATIVQGTGSLSLAMGLVDAAAELNDKQFFIDFGKCLSGKIKNTALFGKHDRGIAEIVFFHPRMSAKAAVRELVKRGHYDVTEDNFRMRKMRLLKDARKLKALVGPKGPLTITLLKT